MAKKPTYEDLQRRVTELEKQTAGLRETETAFRIADLWQERIFNSLEEAVLVVTPDRKLGKVNDGALRMFGYSREELASLSTAILHVDQDHYAEFGEIIQEAFNRGEPANFEFEAKRKTGEIFPTQHTVTLLKGNQGEHIGIVSVVRDITERKQYERELEKRVEERTAELVQSNQLLQDEITERKRAEEALQESEERFRHLSEAAFEAIAIHDGGVVISANDQYFEMFGYEPTELLGKQVISLTAAPEAREFMKKQIATGGRGPYKSIGLRKDGTKFPMEIRVREMEYKGRKVRVGAVMDITERKKGEEALKANEERYRTLFENNPIETITVDLEGRVTRFNKVKERAAKKRPGDRLPNIGDRMYTEDYAGEHTIDMRAELMDCLRSGRVKEFPELKYNGVVWQTNISPFPEGAIITSIDITDRKKAEEELKKSKKQLQYLSSQLIQAQEEERRRISLELHDEMGQSLTAIGLILAQIEEALPPDIVPEIRNRLADIQSITLKASEQVSELCLALRPSMLDDIGLIPTLRWHLNKAARRAELEIKFETLNMDERLGPEIETVLFRISQEAVNNIIKHADAKHVIVSMERKQGSITLSIKDDGKGFDVHETLTDHQEGRIGLIGMQERASIVGGGLSIQSSKGDGTQVLIEIPVGI